MANSTKLGLAMALLLGSAGLAVAQGSASTGQAVPDSNMAKPSGNTGAANNGIGQQGSLSANAGSHASTVTGPAAAAAAQIVTSPQPASHAGNDPKVEGDPSQGGSKPR